MRIMTVGESWLGSSARSLREALARQPGVLVCDVSEDLAMPVHYALPLRMANRLLFKLHQAEMVGRIQEAADSFRPDIIVVFKGTALPAAVVRRLRTECAPVVNSFPDPSPHIYGSILKEAMHEYDLVISRKVFHPALWKSVYGYQNRCVHVSYGYDPLLHEVRRPSEHQPYDVVMIATWRREYEALVREMVRSLKTTGVRIALGGHGWKGRGMEALGAVDVIGGRSGFSYVEWLRRGKIVVAPVWRDVQAETGEQPGDEMTERTLECAAAHTFFLHRRTDEARRLYAEDTEVPMFEGGVELAGKIDHFLAHDEHRRTMAAAAHRRAVPAYSIDYRATEIVSHLRDLIDARSASAPVS